MADEPAPEETLAARLDRLGAKARDLAGACDDMRRHLLGDFPPPAPGVNAVRAGAIGAMRDRADDIEASLDQIGRLVVALGEHVSAPPPKPTVYAQGKGDLSGGSMLKPAAPIIMQPPAGSAVQRLLDEKSPG